MAHLFIHAGLHKTGSTSLQHMLRENRKALPEGTVFVSRGSSQFGALANACRNFDAKALRASNAAIAAPLQAILRDLAPSANTCLLLSAEDFAGQMPSTRQSRPLYHTAPAVARALLAAADRHQVTFVYYSRDRNAWLQSWYKHQLIWRATPVSWEELRLRPNVIGFDPANVALAVRAAIPAEVISLAMEDDLTTPLGPGTGFLRVAGVCDVDMARLCPVRPMQQAPRDWVFTLLRSRLFNALPVGLRRRLKSYAVRLDRLLPRR